MKYIAKEDNIDNLPLSKRASNCLHRTHVHTIGDLLSFPLDRLADIRNVGKTTIEEIVSTVNALSEDSGEWKIVDSNQTAHLQENLDDQTEEPQPAPKTVRDSSIETLGLSMRATNALMKYGITRTSQLIGLREEEVSAIKNIGTQTAAEIMNVVQNVNLTYVGTGNDGSHDDKSNNHVADCETPKIIQGLTEAFGQTDAFWMREYLMFRDLYPEAVGETLVYLFYEQANVRKAVKEGILKIIENHNEEISKKSFYNYMPASTHNTTIIDEIMLELESERMIQSSESAFYRQYPSVFDLLDQLKDERGKEIVFDRLNGKTLQGIGDKYGLTRERIRQLISKNLRSISKKRKREDKYKYIYQNYDISCEDMMIAYDEPVSTYLYLDETYRRDIGKLKPLEEILADETVSVSMRKKAEKAIYKAYITINGVRVKKSRAELVWFYVKNCCKEQTKFDDFVSFYHGQLEELGLGDRHDLFIESRTYENRLSASTQVLWNQGRSFRYYNISDYDFQELLDALHLDQYQDIEISTFKLFRDHSELMREYDIRDEYELHNLLKKVYPSEHSKINFSRMPMLEIGHADRNKQVLTLLMNNAPITPEDLAEKYEEMYGAKAPTVMSNYFGCVSVYYHNGLFTLPDAVMSDEELERMRFVLADDCYVWSELQRLYLREYPTGDLAYINPHNLKRLGFRVYSGYVMKNHLPNAAEYFSSLLVRDDVVDIRTLGTHLNSFPAFTTELYRLRSEREIIEFAPYRYVNIRRLNQVGISVSDIENYCHAVNKFVEKGEFFTVQSLRKKGFVHALDELGFEDWFYASLLIEDREHFVYRRLGGVRLLRKGATAITLGDMLVDVLLNEEKIEIHDLCDLLMNTYAINIPSWKIIDCIRESGLYYDSIMETVYIDYDTYFEEI